MKIRHNKLYDTTHLLKPTSLKQKMKKSASAHREGGVYELRCRRPAGGHRNVCASARLKSGLIFTVRFGNNPVSVNRI